MEHLAPLKLYSLDFDPRAYGARWADAGAKYFDRDLDSFVQVGFSATEGTLLFRVEKTGRCYAADLALTVAAVSQAERVRLLAERQPKLFDPAA